MRCKLGRPPKRDVLKRGVAVLTRGVAVLTRASPPGLPGVLVEKRTL